ncbi:MAG: DUF1294 domain-containing protein [Thermoflexaceae bacterium]|nr:DUF1294 domain-containing protein [Thermoflexaceae bacterium]
MKFIGIYLICINAATFLIYGIDKYKAVKNRWRISEATLIIVAIIGGSIGALAGMKVFHHKTKKKKFSLGVPVILIIQFLMAVGIYYLGGR